jgi:hypothetical protein
MRASPSPQVAEPAPRGVFVAGHAPAPLGFPVFRAISMCLHAVANAPAGSWGYGRSILPTTAAFPQPLAGSAPASCLFEACSAFTHVTACMLAESPKRPFPPKASTILLPPSPLRLLPAGTTVAGRELHPLKMHDFARRTRGGGHGLTANSSRRPRKHSDKAYYRPYEHSDWPDDRESPSSNEYTQHHRHPRQNN